jgi:putative hydroxymethylpyrimidine transport system ATP-binding protein
MTEAPILLLDEPFGALDTITRGRLQDWLADLLDDIEGTLLFVTHDLEEAVLLSQRVLVLTDRPTHVLEEIPLHFESERARRNRLGSAFLLYKAKIARLIEEGGGKNGGLHEPI